MNAELNAEQQLARLLADLRIEKLVKENFGSKKSKANIDIIRNLKQLSLDTQIEIFENYIILCKKYSTFTAMITIDRGCNLKKIEISTKYMTNYITTDKEYNIEFGEFEKTLDSICYTTSMNLLPALKLNGAFDEQLIHT